MIRPRVARARWFVYVLWCADESLYTGCTNDLERRLRQHNDGRGARYTRSRRPVVLVWRRRVKDRPAALRLEARLKRLTRAEKLMLVQRADRRREARQKPPVS